jgi:hypothetical protein
MMGERRLTLSAIPLDNCEHEENLFSLAFD